jgi:hypothetical protein
LGTLQGMGFELNPYDTCVGNKMIDGKQCIIVWYVDINKISHMDKQEVVTGGIERIKKTFRKMTVTWGKRTFFWAWASSFTTMVHSEHQNKGLHKRGHLGFWRGHHQDRYNTGKKEPF